MIYVIALGGYNENEGKFEIRMRDRVPGELFFRTTEGSGLGLAIAKSFTEACGGRFTVSVDGDLFTAAVEFSVCSCEVTEK